MGYTVQLMVPSLSDTIDVMQQLSRYERLQVAPVAAYINVQLVQPGTPPQTYLALRLQMHFSLTSKNKQLL